MPVIFQWFIGNDTLLELGHYNASIDCFCAGATQYPATTINAWYYVPEAALKFPITEVVDALEKKNAENAG